MAKEQDNQAWHVHYLQTFTGILKLFQVTGGIITLIMLLYASFDFNTNHLIMGGHGLVLSLVSFSFSLTTTVLLLAILLGGTDVPYTVFYRVHSVLASVAFVVSGLTYMVEESDSPRPSMTGIIAASICVLASVAFFADAIVAYEPTIEVE